MSLNIFDKQNKPPWQIKKYEELLRQKKPVYFDVDDFEVIIDHYFLKGQLKKTLDTVNYAVSLHTSSSTILLKRAQVLAAAGKENNALDILFRLESLEPSNPDISLTKGAIYSQMKKYEKAIEEYSKAVNNAEHPDYVYCNIAFEYENMGNYNKTLEYLRKALEINPDNDLAIYEAAYCFDLLSLNEESISFFKKLIDKHPYSVEAWFNLGISYINTGLYEKSHEAFDYAIAIEENHTDSWFHKGFVYGIMNDFPKAVNCYLNSIGEDEQDGIKFYYIGECYEKMENYHESAKYYRICLDKDDSFAEAWMGLAICCSELGETKSALKHLERALSLEPDNIACLCLLAETYMSCNMFDKAQECFRKALLINPEEKNIWLNYAEACVFEGQKQKAVKILYEAHEKLPGESSILYKVSQYLFQQGKNQEASFFLEEALIINYEAHKNLVNSYPAILNNSTFVQLIELYKP